MPLSADAERGGMFTACLPSGPDPRGHRSFFLLCTPVFFLRPAFRLLFLPQEGLLEPA